MKRLSLRIDVTKIDKNKIIPRSYDSNGETVTEQNYSFNLIPNKEEKIIKSTDTYDMVKVGFLAERTDSKDEKGRIIGEAFEFRDKEPPSEKVDTGEAPNIDDIPF